MDNLDYTIKDKLLRSQLVNIRKSKHLTQKQISEISGLSTACISNIESSDLTSPTVRSLLRYADALGVDLYIGIDISKAEDQTGITYLQKQWH